MRSWKCWGLCEFLEKGCKPCFQNATILLFNFHGGGHPKNLGGGQQEDRKRICDEEWGYGLSIKYHEQLLTQYKVNSPSLGSLRNNQNKGMFI